MRKRHRVLIFAALVAALIVPVGYALSIDGAQTARHTRYAAVVPTAATAIAAPIAIHRTTDPAPASTLWAPMFDAAKLVCIGTVLFGLAAAVRKTI